MKGQKKYWIVMGLAMGLPTTVLAIALIIYYLIEQKIISQTAGLVILILTIVNIFYLMIRHVLRKKD